MTDVEPEQATTLSLAVVVAFRNEEQFLPSLFASIERQTAPAQEVLLVDDGSTDRSGELSESFCRQIPNARYLLRPRESADQDPRTKDRLVAAPELLSFQWGVTRLQADWDIVTKMDGDLELPPTLFADIRTAMARDSRLGMVGSYLAVRTGAGQKREYQPVHHVRGPNKFYRRLCYSEIQPIPAHLGWDTIDELRARQRGWQTYSISPASGDVIHLRPTGAHDGRLRAYWRWGICAWGYGAHPLGVVAGALRRARQQPYGLGGVLYLAGFVYAAVTGEPRVDEDTRAFARSEDLRRIRGAIRAKAIRRYQHQA